MFYSATTHIICFANCYTIVELSANLIPYSYFEETSKKCRSQHPLNEGDEC